MLEKLTESMVQMQGESKKDKILAAIETMLETMPPMVTMLIRPNLSLVQRYVDEVSDDDIDQAINELHTILYLVDGLPYDRIEEAMSTCRGYA